MNQILNFDSEPAQRARNGVTNILGAKIQIFAIHILEAELVKTKLVKRTYDKVAIVVQEIFLVHFFEKEDTRLFRMICLISKEIIQHCYRILYRRKG